MRQIDSKYHVKNERIIKTTNGEEIPYNEPLFLFRARDKLARDALIYYKFLCVSDGCTDYQLDGINVAIEKFDMFAIQNPTIMKQPGVTLGK